MPLGVADRIAARSGSLAQRLTDGIFNTAEHQHHVRRNHAAFTAQKCHQPCLTEQLNARCEMTLHRTDGIRKGWDRNKPGAHKVPASRTGCCWGSST